jgi:hypothetical protein
MGHLAQDVLYSTRCGTVLVHVWKNGGTMLEDFLTSEHNTACKFAIQYDGSPHRVPASSWGVTGRMRAAMGRLAADRSLRWSAFVREPTARFLSGFHEHLDRAGFRSSYPLIPDFSALVRKAVHYTNGTSQGHPRTMEVLANLTLAPMLHLLERMVETELTRPEPEDPFAGSKEWLAQFHLAPQMSFLTNWGGELLPLQYVGRLDAVQEELGFVLQEPNLSQITRKHHFDLGRVESISTEVLAQHQRLQRAICKLMLVDYCCLGFDLPRACSNISCIR